MQDNDEPTFRTLEELLIKPGELRFVFRTGMFKQFTLQAHQFPMKNTYCELHKTALHRIPLIYLKDGDTYFIMVSARNEGQVQRKEYMVKRAILDLQEQYGWEVKTC